MLEPCQLVGHGLVAHTIAAFSKRPIVWDADVPPTQLPDRPLLLYPQHRWVIETLKLEAQPVTEVLLESPEIAYTHLWRSADFNMSAFGWLIRPAALYSALKEHIRPHPRQTCRYRLIATGQHLPPNTGHTTQTGSSFSSILSCLDTASPPGRLSFSWQTTGVYASLPHPQAQHTYEVHTKSEAEPGSMQAYCRVPLDPSDIFLGDSQLLLPPTLASGYNTTLNILTALSTHSSWEHSKAIATRIAQRQFWLSQTYHHALSCSWTRHQMLALFKQPACMHWAIQQVLHAL